MLYRIFTWLFTGSPREKQPDVSVQKRLALLEQGLAGACDKLDELHSEHRKLRGRFYQARGELESVATTRTETKAQALARIGYVPGRPAPHRE
jgi:hypothetical protein